MKANLLIPVLLILASCRPNPSEKTGSAPQPEQTVDAPTTAASNLSAEATKGKTIFESNCASCHTVDEKLIGPALKGVNERHPEEWLLKFIRNSQKMIKEGDPLAVKLFEENNKIVMTSFEHLSDDEIRNILKYIGEAGKPQP